MNHIYVKIERHGQSMTAIMSGAPDIEFCAMLGRLHLQTKNRRYFVAFDPEKASSSQILAFMERVFYETVTETKSVYRVDLVGSQISSGGATARTTPQNAAARTIISTIRVFKAIRDGLRDWLSLRTTPHAGNSEEL